MPAALNGMPMDPSSVQTETALRNVSATLDALEMVAMCNALLAASGIDAHVNSVDEVCSLVTSTSILVAAMECITGGPLAQVVRYPTGTQDRLWNCRVLLSELSALLSADLSHISAERVLAGDFHDMRDVLEILVSLLRAVPRLAGQDHKVDPGHHPGGTKDPPELLQAMPPLLYPGHDESEAYASRSVDRGKKRSKKGKKKHVRYAMPSRVQFSMHAGGQPAWGQPPAADAAPPEPAVLASGGVAAPQQYAQSYREAPPVPEESWQLPDDEDDGPTVAVWQSEPPFPRPKTSRGRVSAATTAAAVPVMAAGGSPAWEGAFSPEASTRDGLLPRGGPIAVAVGGEMGHRASPAMHTRQMWARGEEQGEREASGSIPMYVRQQGQSQAPARGLPSRDDYYGYDDKASEDEDGGWGGERPARYLATSDDTQDLERDIIPGDRTIVLPVRTVVRRGKRRGAAVRRTRGRAWGPVSNLGYVTVAGLDHRKSKKKSKKRKARRARPQADNTSDLLPSEGVTPGDARWGRDRGGIGDGAVASSVLLSAHPGLHKYFREQLWSLGEMRGKAGGHCLRAAVRVLKRSEELDRAAHVRAAQAERLRAAARRKEELLASKKREQQDRVALHEHRVEQIRSRRFQEQVVLQELARRQRQHAHEYALLKKVFLHAVRQEKERLRGDVREERQHATIYQQQSDALYTNADAYYREQCAILQEQIRWERLQRDQASRDDEVMMKEMAREARSRVKGDRGMLLQQVAHEEEAAHFNVMDPKLISENMVAQLKRRLAQS